MRRVRVGTRASALARWQTDHVLARWREVEPSLDVEVVDLSTAGDDQPDAPLHLMDGTGFFTSALERALLAGEVDVAVHSCKDLPTTATEGLKLAAVPARGPIEDALCGREGIRLRDLAPGSRVGTSSVRRTAQLRALRRDLQFVPLRGNVPTRLERVKRHELDAVVLARAGLVRLGLEENATETFPLEQVLPAPAQGALAIQVRADDAPLAQRLAPLEDAAARQAVEAERELLRQLRGGCSVPVGACARVAGGDVVLDAGVFAPEGDRALRVRVVHSDPCSAGAEAARRLLRLGADGILAALEREPRLAWER